MLSLVDRERLNVATLAESVLKSSLMEGVLVVAASEKYFVYLCKRIQEVYLSILAFHFLHSDNTGKACFDEGT